MRTDMEIRKGELITAIVLLVISISLFIGALEMPRGTLSHPGPGLYPLAISTMLAGGSVLLFVYALMRKGDKEIAKGLIHSSIVWTYGSLFVFLAVITTLGTLLAIIIFLSSMFYRFSTIQRKYVLVAAIVGALMTWMVFELALGVQLPRGMLDLGIRI
jgi:putative tricarboxylic transport membrane protein